MQSRPESQARRANNETNKKNGALIALAYFSEKREAFARQSLVQCLSETNFKMPPVSALAAFVRLSHQWVFTPT
jgi:hypothetical protein